MPENAYIYWDNSNIFIGAKRVASQKEPGSFAFDARIHFDNLFGLARAGRSIGAALCVGSVPPDLEAVWDRLKATGVTVELYERGAGSGREQGIDQCLQVHMLRALADVRPPQVATLLTGDGAGYEEGAGFYADLERMARAGWGVEVLSWDRCCKKAFRDWAKSVGVYIPLEDYYNSITFIDSGRRSQPLSLTRRPKAKPKAGG